MRSFRQHSEAWDTDDIHSTSSDTSRLTASTAGKYFIFGQVTWDANANGVRRISIQLNGATPLASERALPVPADTMPVTIATHADLAAGDFVELAVDQDTGGALDVVVTGPAQSVHFGMVKLP